MGQAKVRGSFEQRKAAAIERAFLESLKKAEQAEIKRKEREQRMKEYAEQQEKEREARFAKWEEEYKHLPKEELEEKLSELEDEFQYPQLKKQKSRSTSARTLMALYAGALASLSNR